MKGVRTDLTLTCPCEAKSAVFQNASRWYSHCVNCGRMTFWSNPALTARAEHGGKLCSHKPEVKDCKGGKTSWCKLCRVRVFIPGA